MFPRKRKKNKLAVMLLAMLFVAASPATIAAESVTPDFDLNEATTTAQDSCDDVNLQVATVFGQRVKDALPQSSSDTVYTAIQESEAAETNTMESVTIPLKVSDILSGNFSFSSIFKAVQQKVISIIDNMWNKLQDLFKKVFEQSLKAVQNKINEAYMKQVQRIAKNLGSYGSVAFTQAMSGMVPNLENMATACTNAGLNACANAAFTNLSEQVQNNASAAAKKLGDAVPEVINQEANKTINQGISIINQEAQSAAGKVIDSVENSVLGN